ncbi:MAG: hypothetical protein K2Q06_14585, partial [Parvularculaceae bacterium]|nr:hypothetical protein [Parvularculaceae bacterium]
MSRARILNIVLALISLVCIWSVVEGRAARPDFTLAVGILANKDDEDYAGALAFKDYVESRAGGRVAVKIYASGQFCGGERECIENLQSGVLDVFMTTFGGFGNFYGAAQA